MPAIESKESLYTPFTSKEIIDHFVSYVHNQTEGRADYSKYNVFALKIKNQPATIRSKPRKRQPKFELYVRVVVLDKLRGGGGGED